MRHLIAILSNHDHWQSYPITGHDADGDTYLFLDHRMPITDRAQVIRDVAARDHLDEVVRIVLEPPPGDCAAGVHDWRIVERDDNTVGAECAACDASELFDMTVRYVDVATSAHRRSG